MQATDQLFKEMKGKPINHLGYRIIPVSKSMQMQIPHITGGLIWNRPSEVIIQTPNLDEHRIPIKDRTRRIQVLILAFGILGSIFISNACQYKNKKTKERK